VEPGDREEGGAEEDERGSDQSDPLRGAANAEVRVDRQSYADLADDRQHREGPVEGQADVLDQHGDLDPRHEARRVWPAAEGIVADVETGRVQLPVHGEGIPVRERGVDESEVVEVSAGDLRAEAVPAVGEP